MRVQASTPVTLVVYTIPNIVICNSVLINNKINKLLKLAMINLKGRKLNFKCLTTQRPEYIKISDQNKYK